MKTTLTTVTTLTILLAAALGARAQDKGAAKAQADQAAMMKAWADFASPNENHKRLEPLAGSWTTHTKFWMTPGAPPQESEGTSDFVWVLGERYLQQQHHGQYMGKPFNGIGYQGYDNFKKKYLSVWMDDMGTSIMSLAGKASADGKSVASEGTMDDIMSKKPIKVTDKLTLVDADRFTYEMWMVDAKSGKAFKTLEMSYTRKK